MSNDKDMKEIMQKYEQMTSCEKKAFQELVKSIIERLENEGNESDEKDAVR